MMFLLNKLYIHPSVDSSSSILSVPTLKTIETISTDLSLQKIRIRH